MRYIPTLVTPNRNVNQTGTSLVLALCVDASVGVGCVGVWVRGAWKSHALHATLLHIYIRVDQQWRKHTHSFSPPALHQHRHVETTQDPDGMSYPAAPAHDVERA